MKKIWLFLLIKEINEKIIIICHFFQNLSLLSPVTLTCTPYLVEWAEAVIGICFLGLFCIASLLTSEIFFKSSYDVSSNYRFLSDQSLLKITYELTRLCTPRHQLTGKLCFRASTTSAYMFWYHWTTLVKGYYHGMLRQLFRNSQLEEPFCNIPCHRVLPRHVDMTSPKDRRPNY